MASSLLLRTKFDLFYIFLLTNSYCHLPLFLLCKSHHHYCNYVSLVGIIQSFFLSNKDRRPFFIYYYYVCLPWLPWNSSAYRKHIPGRRGIVCAQTNPGWIAAGLVLTPLLSILEPITVEGNPMHNTQKRPLQTIYAILWFYLVFEVCFISEVFAI